MNECFDVIIVGGRCAGASLARITADAGIRTLVIDRATFPSDTVSTHAIAAHGVELLDTWGLRDAVLDTGAPEARQLRITAGDLDTTIAIPVGLPGVIAPRRTILDNLLVGAARQAGAEVWEAATFLGVVSDAEGRVAGMRCRVAGREIPVSARVVVGADGMYSAVAHEVGALSYDVRPSNCAGVYAYYENTDIIEFAMALADRRFLLALPTNDELVCLASACHTDDFPVLHSAGEHGWNEVADTVAPHIGTAARQGRRVSRFVVFKCPPGRYRQPYGPGWALVGDAGHYTDPFTGQGIANAFLGAHLLGRALIDGLGGGVPFAAALAGYERERARLTGEIHGLTHDLATFDWDVPTGVAWLLRRRELGDRLHDEVAALRPTVHPAGAVATRALGAA